MSEVKSKEEIIAASNFYYLSEFKTTELKGMMDQWADQQVKSNSQGIINFILEVCDTKELIGQPLTLEELKNVIQIAKDNWFTIRAKELLSWMAKHDVDCKVITNEGDMFYYKGELISADQLFENFL